MSRHGWAKMLRKTEAWEKHRRLDLAELEHASKDRFSKSSFRNSGATGATAVFYPGFGAMAGAQVQVEADMSILTGIDNGTGSAWQAPGSVSYPGLSSSLLEKKSFVTGYRLLFHLFQWSHWHTKPDTWYTQWNFTPHQPVSIRALRVFEEIDKETSQLNVWAYTLVLAWICGKCSLLSMN